MEWWAIAAMAAAIGGVGWWWWSRRPPADGARKDRYAAEAVITPAQAKLYRHLQEAFPDQVVLFAQPLSQLVSVRHAGDRQRALQRLRDQVVDFVVCAPDGKPSLPSRSTLTEAAMKTRRGVTPRSSTACWRPLACACCG